MHNLKLHPRYPLPDYRYSATPEIQFHRFIPVNSSDRLQIRQSVGILFNLHVFQIPNEIFNFRMFKVITSFRELFHEFQNEPNLQQAKNPFRDLLQGHSTMAFLCCQFVRDELRSNACSVTVMFSINNSFGSVMMREKCV